MSPNSTDIFSTEPAGHITIHHEAVEPNCSAVGNVEYWECESCQKYFSNEAAATEIELENTVLEKAPDRHITDGSSWHFDKDTHWKTCVCGEVLDNVGHTFTWVIDREPTEQANGLKHEECPVCGYAKAAVEIPATGTTTEPTEPEKPTEPTKPSEPEEPSTSGETDSPDETMEPDEEPYEESTDSTVSPRTGDNSNTAFWFVLVVIAGTGFVSMFHFGKEQKQ